MRLSAVLAFTALAASLPHAHASFPFPFTIHALPELTSPVGATCRKFLAADKIHKTCFFVPPTAATPEMIKSSFVEMCSKPICAQSDVDAFAKEMTKACSTDIKLHPAVKNLDDYISDLKIVFTWYTTFREVDCYVDTDKELVTYKLREAFARATWGGPRPTETELCTKGNRYAVGTIIATMEKNPAKFEPHVVYVDGVKNFWRLECGPGYDTDLDPVHGPPYPDLQKKMTVMPSIPDTTKNTSPKKSAAKLENGLTSDVAVSNVAGDDKDVSFRNDMKNTKDSTLSSISKKLTWVFDKIFYPSHSDGGIPLEEEAPSNSDTRNSNKDTGAENPAASDGIELAETASPEESATKLENVLTSDVAQPTVSDVENDITLETGVKNTADNTPSNPKEGRIPTVKSASNSETFPRSKTDRKKSAEDDRSSKPIKEASGNVKSQPTSAEAPTAESGNTAIESFDIENPSEGDGQLKNAVEIQSEKDENSEDEKLPEHQSGDAVPSTFPAFTMFLATIGFAIQLQ